MRQRCDKYVPGACGGEASPHRAVCQPTTQPNHQIVRNHRAIISARLLLLLTACPAAALLGQAAPSSQRSVTPPDTAETTRRVQWGSGVSVGSLHFGGGAREQALSASLRARFWNTLDVLVNPTWASATAADSINGTRVIPGRTVHGMTALPVHVGVGHTFDRAWAPTLSAGLGFTVPTGDSTGVGSRQAGYGVSVEVGLTPNERFDVALGVSHALNDAFSAGLGASSPTNVSVGTSYAVGIARLNVQYSGDAATPAAGFDPSRSIGGGVSVPLYGNIALTLDGVTGLTSGSPSWSFTLGVGVTPAGVAEVAIAPLSRAGRAFGLGRTLRGSKGTKPRRNGKRSVP